MEMVAIGASVPLRHYLSGGEGDSQRGENMLPSTTRPDENRTGGAGAGAGEIQTGRMTEHTWMDDVAG